MQESIKIWQGVNRGHFENLFQLFSKHYSHYSAVNELNYSRSDSQLFPLFIIFFPRISSAQSKSKALSAFAETYSKSHLNKKNWMYFPRLGSIQSTGNHTSDKCCPIAITWEISWSDPFYSEEILGVFFFFTTPYMRLNVVPHALFAEISSFQHIHVEKINSDLDNVLLGGTSVYPYFSAMKFILR